MHEIIEERSKRTTLSLRLGVCNAVALDALKELLPTLRVPDVLNPDVHPLLDVAVADDLVDDDTHRTGGNVVDDTSAPVVADYSKSHRYSSH